MKRRDPIDDIDETEFTVLFIVVLAWIVATVLFVEWLK